MAHFEKLSIALTPEMAAVVRQCVESGEYACSSKMIREALREWKLSCNKPNSPNCVAYGTPAWIATPVVMPISMR